MALATLLGGIHAAGRVAPSDRCTLRNKGLAVNHYDRRRSDARDWCSAVAHKNAATKRHKEELMQLDQFFFVLFCGWLMQFEKVLTRDWLLGAVFFDCTKRQSI